MTLEARLVQKLAALTSSLSQCVRLVWLPAPQLVVVRSTRVRRRSAP